MKIDLRKYSCVDALNCGLELCKEIKSYGHEAYVVGGCVRDIVRCELGQTSWPSSLVYTTAAIHDIDIATNMPIQSLKKVFRTESNNGEEHGTILVFYGMGDPFEVTQFRTDGEYSDARHPDSVKFTRSFEDDVKRRDFTMNAIGMDGEGNIVDFVGGVDDIKNRVIRTVGNPYERFREDALRIVRGVRFAVNFDYTIDISTKSAMNIAGPGLSKVSKERFRKEITSLNKKNYGLSSFLQYLTNLDLVKHIPIFEHMNFTAAYENSLLVPDMSNDNVFAVMALSYDDIANAEVELTMTKDEKRLYKFYKWARHMLWSGSCPPWTDLVKIVSNDYRTVLAIMQNRTDWLWTIPVAIRLASSFPVDQSKFSAEVEKMGIKPGPKFGAEVKARVEAYYKTMAGLIL